MCGSVCESDFSGSKEEWVVSTSGEPEAIESLHQETAFQDGRCEHAEGPASKGRLDSIYQSQGCLSVMMAEEHRKFLHFMWEGQTYQFQCLPFGLRSAPRVFTNILKPVMALLRRQGIRTIIFLDDMIIMAQSKEELLQQIEEIIQLWQLLGFIINWEKSQLNPVQKNQFLGFEVDSRNMTIYLPQEKLERVVQACSLARHQETMTVCDLSRLIRRMTATMQVVLPAPLCYRNLQRLKNQALKQSQSFEARVIMDQSAKDELGWWIDELRNWNGRAVLPQVPDMIVETDASRLGWGAACEGVCTGGLWSEEERTQHINCLELMGGVFAVRTFAKGRNNIHIRLRMDNKTAIKRHNTLGRTSTGVDNRVADKESRTIQSSAEWKLHERVFHQVIHLLGPCQVDLFATRLNCQLSQYVSWQPDPFAMATDAFQIPWKDFMGYAFPLFALIGRCLQKVRQEECSLLLIAPFWCTHTWYPALLELLIDDPLLLPARRDLLRDPFNRYHPLLLRKQLQLVAWKVSGNHTLRVEFRSKLPSLSSQDGVRAQTQLTSQVGGNGIAGVFGGRLIPFRVVSNPFWTF